MAQCQKVISPNIRFHEFNPLHGFWRTNDVPPEQQEKGAYFYFQVNSICSEQILFASNFVLPRDNETNTIEQSQLAYCIVVQKSVCGMKHLIKNFSQCDRRCSECMLCKTLDPKVSAYDVQEAMIYDLQEKPVDIFCSSTRFCSYLFFD